MTLRTPAGAGHPASGRAGPVAAFAADVQYYLQLDPRQLPSRYFYDDLGSWLFEAICRLPWYPLTRAETRLLTAHRREILEARGSIGRVVELGSGSGDKLATLAAGRRQPSPLELHLIDVSPTALAVSARALSSLPGIHVVTHEEAYEAGLATIRGRGAGPGRTLVLLLGSNIGNFDPPGAEELLREIRAALCPGDLFLLGADLVKPEPRLLLAYDDPLGVTAAFNRNLLVRINRELQGDFDVASFMHRALWNAQRSRVEMHLVSRKRATVAVKAAGLEVTFEPGETIWTESSYKYLPGQIRALTERARFAPLAQWVDEEDLFALTLVEAV
jgi:dimethylhistidine N-methyltransferase